MRLFGSYSIRVSKRLDPNATKNEEALVFLKGGIQEEESLEDNTKASHTNSLHSNGKVEQRKPHDTYVSILVENKVGENANTTHLLGEDENEPQRYGAIFILAKVTFLCSILKIPPLHIMKVKWKNLLMLTYMKYVLWINPISKMIFCVIH